MKLLITAMLAFAPMSSFALTYYGDSNQDLTTISVTEYTMARCQLELNKAYDKLHASNKTIIGYGKCLEVKNADAPNFFATIKYHKYL